MAFRAAALRRATTPPSGTVIRAIPAPPATAYADIPSAGTDSIGDSHPTAPATPVAPGGSAAVHSMSRHETNGDGERDRHTPDRGRAASPATAASGASQ